MTGTQINDCQVLRRETRRKFLNYVVQQLYLSLVSENWLEKVAGYAGPSNSQILTECECLLCLKVQVEEMGIGEAIVVRWDKSISFPS